MHLLTTTTTTDSRFIKKLRTPLFRDSSLCEGMREGCCTQPYPCIYKEAVSGFEPMTNKSPRHNFTAAPGLALTSTKALTEKIVIQVQTNNHCMHKFVNSLTFIKFSKIRNGRLEFNLMRKLYIGTTPD